MSGSSWLNEVMRYGIGTPGGSSAHELDLDVGKSLRVAGDQSWSKPLVVGAALVTMFAAAGLMFGAIRVAELRREDAGEVNA